MRSGALGEKTQQKVNSYSWTIKPHHGAFVCINHTLRNYFGALPSARGAKIVLPSRTLTEAQLLLKTEETLRAMQVEIANVKGVAVDRVVFSDEFIARMLQRVAGGRFVATGTLTLGGARMCIYIHIYVTCDMYVVIQYFQF